MLFQHCNPNATLPQLSHEIQSVGLLAVTCPQRQRSTGPRQAGAAWELAQRGGAEGSGSGSTPSASSVLATIALIWSSSFCVVTVSPAALVL
jgi:hypothetical protein